MNILKKQKSDKKRAEETELKECREISPLQSQAS